MFEKRTGIKPKPCMGLMGFLGFAGFLGFIFKEHFILVFFMFFGFFSFYPTKNIGAFGDAGAIVTDNEALYKKVMMLRNYGSSVRYNFELENGSNSRLDEIQAALLLVKIRHAAEITNEKVFI